MGELLSKCSATSYRQIYWCVPVRLSTRRMGPLGKPPALPRTSALSRTSSRSSAVTLALSEPQRRYTQCECEVCRWSEGEVPRVCHCALLAPRTFLLCYRPLSFSLSPSPSFSQKARRGSMKKFALWVHNVPVHFSFLNTSRHFYLEKKVGSLSTCLIWTGPLWETASESEPIKLAFSKGGHQCQIMWFC